MNVVVFIGEENENYVHVEVLDIVEKKVLDKDVFLEDKIHYHDEQKRINLGNYGPIVVVQDFYLNQDDYDFDKQIHFVGNLVEQEKIVLDKVVVQMYIVVIVHQKEKVDIIIDEPDIYQEEEVVDVLLIIVILVDEVEIEIAFLKVIQV